MSRDIALYSADANASGDLTRILDALSRLGSVGRVTATVVGCLIELRRLRVLQVTSVARSENLDTALRLGASNIAELLEVELVKADTVKGSMLTLSDTLNRLTTLLVDGLQPESHDLVE